MDLYIGKKAPQKERWLQSPGASGDSKHWDQHALWQRAIAG
jgi:hypothetical protein